MIIFHDPACAGYSRRDHPERPERITRSASLMKRRHPDWQWRVAQPAPREIIARAHTAEHIGHVASAVEDFDSDTAALPGIFEHALSAAGCAVAAAAVATAGSPTFSLMRPPGHHATRSRAMGFCYFNNIAIAAFDALERDAKRVAIWDFDAHHGNGTEAIVQGDNRIRFSSIHQFPAYPGTGKKSFDNIYNFPVAPCTSRADHVAEARRSLDVLLEFDPDLLLVSAGFDAYASDPIMQMTLLPDDFATFGKWLAQSGLPVAAILEGGYSDELPELIDAFLTAWTKA